MCIFGKVFKKLVFYINKPKTWAVRNCEKKKKNFWKTKNIFGKKTKIKQNIFKKKKKKKSQLFIRKEYHREQTYNQLIRENDMLGYVIGKKQCFVKTTINYIYNPKFDESDSDENEFEQPRLKCQNKKNDNK